MERLYKGFEIIKNHFHTSNQQRHDFYLCSFARRRIKSMIEYQKVLT
ncbi:hypothetical protein PN478_20435 [Dolichospermum circinale CS-534/05]|nr:hypothetical protein [Dolichospermum circinale]MDB9475555.1 hypothetical protein [Dolichospermum circinale CS-537/11]MDB9477620.1 hypothetical protein [Dolichospermum circinale CS-537/03]MDB9492869.1 hypothetical protein [Dolichospermum circinale CS-534/05]MDB9548661.1 hypothetical protein [Dolichospermum circinale CS-1031]